MSSIGPQLPPHLSKRKRTPDDDGQDAPASPPSKNIKTEGSSRPINDQELDIDDSDSDSDDYGPRAAAPPPSTAAAPYLPADLRVDEIELERDEDEEKPPSLHSVGSPRPLPAYDNSTSEDSDDEWGPSLPNAYTYRQQIGPAMPPAPADALKRDDWMLAPPTSEGYTERDTTRIKSRKFASKPSAKPAGTQAASVWTETREEKLKRLADSVLGRSDPTGAAGPQDGRDAAKVKEEEERNRRIAASVEAKRGKSLLDEHGQNRQQAGLDKEEDDDPSKRAFDREKDMAIGGKIGTAQRQELLNNAANFGGRFSKGSYL